ncbi:MAG: hypothetical protein AAF483_23785 [Planctomycetota bacterium]
MELTLAIAVMLILSAGIFAISGGALEMTTELNDYHDQEAIRNRFIELCRINFEDLPGNAQIEFLVLDRGKYYATYLSIANAPFAFSFGGAPPQVARVVLSAEVEAGGYLRIRSHYLNQKQGEVFAEGEFETLSGRSVVLLRRLRQFTWRFYDSSRGIWLESWDSNLGNPSMVELTFRMEGDLEPTRSVFWVPKKQAPAKPSSTSENSVDEGFLDSGSTDPVDTSNSELDSTS